MFDSGSFFLEERVFNEILKIDITDEINEFEVWWDAYSRQHKLVFTVAPLNNLKPVCCSEPEYEPKPGESKILL